MQGQGNRTCLEQISLRAPGVTRAQVEAAADAVGATRFIRALPRGFDHDVLEEGKSLSSGQKQLLAFARAFLLDPGVVIMDEATASVDAESERVIETALDTLLHGRTAIIIAHRLSTIRSAQRVPVLHHGRLTPRPLRCWRPAPTPTSWPTTASTPRLMIGCERRRRMAGRCLDCG